MHSLVCRAWLKSCHGKQKVPYAYKFLTASLSLRAGWQTGVAISFLRWGFPRQCDHWLGMTAIFNLMTLPDGRRSFVYEFYDTGAVESLQDHKLHIKGGGQQRQDRRDTHGLFQLQLHLPGSDLLRIIAHFPGHCYRIAAALCPFKGFFLKFGGTYSKICIYG